MDIKDLLASFAEIDEMEASDGMNIAEDLLDQNIVKASANLGVQDMIDMLLKIVGSYVSEKTLKTIKDQFTLALASGNVEEVNEDASMLADKEGRLTVCISELYDLEEKAIAEENMSVAQAIKDARIYADDVRSELYHPEVYETLVQDGETSNYCEFNVKVYMNGNDTDNKFIKQNVEAALENCFESADYTVEVEDV